MIRAIRALIFVALLVSSGQLTAPPTWSATPSDTMPKASEFNKPITQYMPANVRAILAHPTHVSAYELFQQGGDELHLTDPRMVDILQHERLGRIGDYVVSARGGSVPTSVGPGLLAMLSRTGDTGGLGCFAPGVAFRVWRGGEHVDLCICFHCEGVEVTHRDASGKVIWLREVSLGDARPEFLALSRSLFPKDASLKSLPDHLPPPPSRRTSP